MKSILSLTMKTGLLLALAFFFGAFVAIAADVPQYAPHIGVGAMALSFVPRGMSQQSYLYTINIADVITEWGAVYRAGGQSVKDLLIKLRQRSVTASYFPTRITEATIMEKSIAEFTRVLQRFQKDFTPIGGTTFTPTKIPLYKLKIDLTEYPDELEESWLGFLADKNLDRRKWPFIKWYLENALDQAEQDLELNEIFLGKPGIITPGTATAAGTSLMGIRQLINNADAAGTGGKIVMGAVPSDAKLFVTYVETMIKLIPRLVRNQIDHIFVSEDLHDLFRQGMREKYNVNYEAVSETKITQVRDTTITLVGLPSMVGSSKIWATPQWNRQGGFKKPGNERIFEVEKIDRQVKAYTDYYKGYGFWVNEYLFYNDVDLVDAPDPEPPEEPENPENPE